ncbi:Cu+-exporting ATPase [Bryocella elongata]|uniref:P-type Cu(2+) transporter n=1 Tax=Bryocella elongata TaxID=863522 RepID=A0A1H5ZLG8_9BACT|nr:heavy metal translocating P-type ATPase [Bryocella elongata]SEG37393.1 Cu+-exporting ATPase [Bryocella elongata]
MTSSPLISPPDPSPAHLEPQDLHVQGMTCAACQSHVQRALAAVPGVRAANVNLLAHTARVELNQPIATEQLIAAVRSAGYDASIAPPMEMEVEAKHLGLRATLALIAGALAMLLSMPLMTMAGATTDPLLGFAARHLDPLMPVWLMQLPAQPLRWLLALMALGTMIFGAPEIYAAAWRAAKHGATNMNTLVAIGTIAASVASLASTIAPQMMAQRGLGAEVYFEAVILILAFLLAGRWLESRARARATSALEGFGRLEAKDVRLLMPPAGVVDYNTLPETILPLDAIETGDLLRVLPGDRIPVDGEIVHGRSSIDASMLTGEPLPVSRGIGARASAGTLNLDGVLVLRATAVGAASTLAQMRRLLAQAQNSRAPMERLADRVSAIFVPTVLALSAVTFAVWAVALNTHGAHEGFARPFAIAVAVLIIACPCAMGLAVPAAITVAIGRAAQLGLLIKGGEALERLATVDMLAFDKTGTLTEGEPTIASLVVTPDALYPRKTLIAWAAAAERLSTHPLAVAVVHFAAASEEAKELASIQDLRVLPGIGLEAVVEGHRLALGNASVLSKTTAPSAPLGLEYATPLYLVIDDQLQAAFYAVDTLRPQAAEAVTDLKALGVTPLILTGDVAASAAPIAREAGITEIRAGLLPADKLAAIRTLQQAGRKVAMAGDGINDAAALAQSDAGLAMASGSDLARDAGDAILLHPDLRLLPASIRLARRATAIMRQNLGWALAYNAIGLPIAAGVLYPHFHVLLSPVLASAAMALSSVSVLANSLRLRRA